MPGGFDPELIASMQANMQNRRPFQTIAKAGSGGKSTQIVEFTNEGELSIEALAEEHPQACITCASFKENGSTCQGTVKNICDNFDEIPETGEASGFRSYAMKKGADISTAPMSQRKRKQRQDGDGGEVNEIDMNRQDFKDEDLTMGNADDAFGKSNEMFGAHTGARKDDKESEPFIAEQDLEIQNEEIFGEDKTDEIKDHMKEKYKIGKNYDNQSGKNVVEGDDIDPHRDRNFKEDLEGINSRITKTVAQKKQAILVLLKQANELEKQGKSKEASSIDQVVASLEDEIAECQKLASSLRQQKSIDEEDISAGLSSLFRDR